MFPRRAWLNRREVSVRHAINLPRRWNIQLNIHLLRERAEDWMGHGTCGIDRWSNGARDDLAQCVDLLRRDAFSGRVNISGCSVGDGDDAASGQFANGAVAPV